MCERAQGTRTTSHGFGARFGDGVAPVVETGMANLVDLLAPALDFGAENSLRF